MFLPVKFSDKDGKYYYEHINITHITRLSFVNIMNPDAGTKIHLRTGEVLVTPVPMDIFQCDVDDCFKSSTALLIYSVVAEKAKYFTHDDEDAQNSEPTE